LAWFSTIWSSQAVSHGRRRICKDHLDAQLLH
jgi:transposase InsO family protein